MISHLRGLLATGQARFRAETFGLYYPAKPDRSPWWRVSPRAVRLLLAQFWSYRRWRRDMLHLRSGGAHEWWGRRWTAIDVEARAREWSREDAP